LQLQCEELQNSPISIALLGLGDSVSALNAAVDGLAYIKVMQQVQPNALKNIVDMWNGTAVWSSWDGAITFKTLLGNGFAAARFGFSMRWVWSMMPVFVNFTRKFRYPWRVKLKTVLFIRKYSLSIVMLNPPRQRNFTFSSFHLNIRFCFLAGT
jgi:hypothetical protein